MTYFLKLSLTCIITATFGLTHAQSPTSQMVQPNGPVQVVPTTLEPITEAPASASAPKSGESRPAATSEKGPDLRIGSGDLLQVGVFGVPEFTQEVRVNGDGDVSLPPLHSVHVAGLTPANAEQQIRKDLIAGGYFRDPRVSVFVKEYASQGVSVLGEVNKPGVYPALGSRKLFDMISAAGGLTPKAGSLATITRRDATTATVRVQLSHDGENSPQTNVAVLPGDTIMVSTAPIVYVVGEVGRPGGFVMDRDRVTVLQAIAMAGGVGPTASLKGATLIRRNGGTKEVPINRILQAKASDIPLEGDDILFIPNSTAKSAGRRTLEAIVQAATGVAIYSTPRRNINE